MKIITKLNAFWVPGLAIVFTFALRPIYRGLWVLLGRLLLLFPTLAAFSLYMTDFYLGVVCLVSIIFWAAAAYLLAPNKHPDLKFFSFMMAVLVLVLGLVQMFSFWFDGIFPFSLLF